MLPPSNADIEATRVADYVRMVMQHNAQRSTQMSQPKDDLKAALAAWWDSLPATTRHRKYQLIEISDALYNRVGRRFADRRIAAHLEAAGWASGRSWTRAGRNRRYWQPLTPNEL